MLLKIIPITATTLGLVGNINIAFILLLVVIKPLALYSVKYNLNYISTYLVKNNFIYAT